MDFLEKKLKNTQNLNVLSVSVLLFFFKLPTRKVTDNGELEKYFLLNDKF